MLDALYAAMSAGGAAGELIQAVPFACVAGAGYALWRAIRLARKKPAVHWGGEILRWLFACYLGGLFALVLTPRNLWLYLFFFLKNGYPAGGLDPLFSGGYNLTPTLLKCLRGEYVLGSWVREMLAANLLMFAPMGVFLPLVCRRMSRRTAVLLAAAIPLEVELLQPVIGRSFDVDDLLMNFAGILLGYGVAAALRALAKRRRRFAPEGPAAKPPRA